MAKVAVNLSERSYDIIIEQGSLKDIGSWVAGLSAGRRILIVADENSAKLFGENALANLKSSGLAATMAVVPPGEASKSLFGADRIYEAAIRAGLDRTDSIVALGGGVIGDLAGFVASTYLRGIDFFQVPTTLLSQVDSSVGGKVAVNHSLGKNLIGAFYQPRGVLIDPETLRSLSEREFCSGMAEVLKYGLIREAGFFDELAENSREVLNRDIVQLESIIAKCCRMKAEYVERDERDNGERIMLNFGHTIGHAIEAAGEFRRFTHGEGVGLGMLAAARLSELLAGLPAGAVDKMRAVLLDYRLPVSITGINPNELIEYMDNDKKRSAGCITWVVLQQPGRAGTLRGISEESVRQALQVII